MISIYKFLFCFSTDVAKVINTLKNYSCNSGYTFHIDHIKNQKELLQINNLSDYKSIIFQEYFNELEPITIEYLEKYKKYTELNTICIFDEDKRNSYAKELYNKKLYNCFFGNDLSNYTISDFVKFLVNGRNENDALRYYNLQNVLGENIYKNLIKEINNIIIDYDNDEELMIEEIGILTKNLNDYDIKIVLTELSNDKINKLLCIPKFYCQYEKIKNNIFPPSNKKNSIFDKKSNETIKLIPVNCRNIGVVSLSNGAGSTFITMNLACALSERVKVSVIEYPLLKPYIYNYLGLNTLCINGYVDFCSLPHMINNEERITPKYYVHQTNKNIFWIIQDATLDRIENWDSKEMMRLLYLPKESSINVIDLGDKLFNSSITDILEQFSMIIVIIDPMVPNLLNSITNFEKIKELEKTSKTKILYVINKFSKGVNKKELLGFLDITPTCYIPYINSKDIYKAVYEGTIPYNYTSVKSELNGPFSSIIENIISLKMLKSHNRKKKKIRRLSK
ncbi:hypothetical protein JYG23_09480 [Sedimentibacter sp. zth1]|uniref:hypothetical protein n=1 Tax=Sedimentibacter sp. zth1 TaxID=2816908 RepID=UPI001A921204|nr:hypothetical protein [Sedimentibacter sp. zth1]QSX04922.1 hypothetical protein JYG23_09480 [Sedimentibacter sp. zth1]